MPIKIVTLHFRAANNSHLLFIDFHKQENINDKLIEMTIGIETQNQVENQLERRKNTHATTSQRTQRRPPHA